MELVRKEVIPYQWETLNDRVPEAAPSYCMHNFKVAARMNKEKRELGSRFQEPTYTFRGFEALPDDPRHPDDDKFYGFVFQDSDFSKWIENNDEMLIYGSTSLENEQRGIDESVWISSGIVKREKLEQFIKALNIYSEGRQELFDVTGFHAHQAGGYYCTPQEACTVRNIKKWKVIFL